MKGPRSFPNGEKVFVAENYEEQALGAQRIMLTIKNDSLLDPEDMDDLRAASTQIRGLSFAREKMIEFRITFEWNQPHGPHPRSAPEANDGDSHGHYTTIFAPDAEIARAMAYCRYNGKWSMIYQPSGWKERSSEMEGCKELEKLQFRRDYILGEWPEKRHFHAGIQIGSPR